MTPAIATGSITRPSSAVCITDGIPMQEASTSQRLQGKVAIVSGDNSGIGEATVQPFSVAGKGLCLEITIFTGPRAFASTPG